jgi:hypothetical protein
MSTKRMNWPLFFAVAFLVSLSPLAPSADAEVRRQTGDRQSTNSFLFWSSPANLCHGVLGKEHGDLVIEPKRLEFRPVKGSTLEWSFFDIQTFFLSPHRLEIKTYLNRRHHVPGVQRYRFHIVQVVPPSVAARLACEVQRPSQNGIPDPGLSSLESIPAHHRTRTGGTNGILRLRSGGIDYITSSPGDSRSWRWADLETLAKPDPYHLFVFGYHDTYTFDLKGPLSSALFNRLTDEIYLHNLLEPQHSLDIETPGGSKGRGQEVGNE